MTKACKNCERELPLSDFPPANNTNSGVRAWCRECSRKRNREWYASHPEKVAAKNRRQTAMRKLQPVPYWPEQGRAHAAVHSALRKGTLIRPDVCPECGDVTRLDAHHEDYSKPLDVTWLCRSCHLILHRRSEAA